MIKSVAVSDKYQFAYLRFFFFFFLAWEQHQIMFVWIYPETQFSCETN